MKLILNLISEEASRKFLTSRKRNTKTGTKWARSHDRISSVAVHSILPVFGREAMVTILIALHADKYSSGLELLNSP